MKSLTKKAEETPYLTLFIEDGILHVHYKEIEVLDLEIAKVCVKARMEYTEYKSYPCLIEAIRFNNFTKEARDYFAREGNEGIIANAIVTRSTVIKMMANFYIMVNKPVNPTRMFTDNGEALKWLTLFTK